MDDLCAPLEWRCPGIVDFDPRRRQSVRGHRRGAAGEPGAVVDASARRQRTPCPAPGVRQRERGENVGFSDQVLCLVLAVGFSPAKLHETPQCIGHLDPRCSEPARQGARRCPACPRTARARDRSTRGDAASRPSRGVLVTVTSPPHSFAKFTARAAVRLINVPELSAHAEPVVLVIPHPAEPVGTQVTAGVGAAVEVGAWRGELGFALPLTRNRAWDWQLAASVAMRISAPWSCGSRRETSSPCAPSRSLGARAWVHGKHRALLRPARDPCRSSACRQRALRRCRLTDR